MRLSRCPAPSPCVESRCCCLFAAGPIGRVRSAGRRSRPPPPCQRVRASRRCAFSGSGQTAHGAWSAEASVSTSRWKPGDAVQIDVTVQIGAGHLASLAAAGIKADRLCVLVTAERTFDADGWMRLPSDEKMSTLLTPTGLAIEGGVQGAVTNRYGYQFGSPLDQFQTCRRLAA